MSGGVLTQRRRGAESGVATRALLDGRFERISCAQRKPLWSVTIWDKKFNSVATGKQTTAIKYHYLLAGDLKEKIVPGGNVKLLTTSETDWWTTEDKVAGLVSEGEIVSIPWGGNPNVQYFKGRFVTADNRIATSSDKTVLDNKFLYYFMLAKRNTIGSFYRGAGLKHPEMSKVLDMEIPLPNIEAQRAFVRCMDNVSKVIAARKMQLDSLSQLVKSRFVEMFGDDSISIGRWDDVFIATTGKLDSNVAKEDGQYPFFTCAKTPLKIDQYAFDCEALLLAGNNAAGVYDVKHYKGKFNAYQRTYVLRLTDDRWEYAVFKAQLESKLAKLQADSKGTMTKYLTLGILKKLDFIVPPLALQREFAAFVEKVDKLAFAARRRRDVARQLYRAKIQEFFG